MSINSNGFTIPELLVVIVLTTIFTTLIMTFTIGYWRYGYLLQADLDTLSTRLNAGDYLRDAVGNSTGLIIQNSIADSHPGAADPNNSSGNYWLPIHAIPSTVTVGSAGTNTPLIYFREPSISSSRAYIMNGSQPYEDEYVLYLNGTTKSLMQRTLKNPSASGDRVQTSCPTSFVTTSCPADKVIASDLASVSMRYFSRNGNLINYISIYDTTTGMYVGPDFPAVEVVELTLNLTKKPAFQKSNATVNSTIIRIALRNS